VVTARGGIHLFEQGFHVGGGVITPDAGDPPEEGAYVNT
jgi:hypothetical protein